MEKGVPLRMASIPQIPLHTGQRIPKYAYPSVTKKMPKPQKPMTAKAGKMTLKRNPSKNIAKLK